MAFQVYLIWGDARRDLAETFGELEAAAMFAFDLADDLGQRPVDGGRAPPAKVAIYRGDLMELSIQVMPGGLLPRRGAPRSRSM